MKNVLVFPCGSEVGLEINRSLKGSRFFNLIGANSVNDHGKFVFTNYIGEVPEVNSPDFILKINEIVKLHDIHFIIPAHDSVVLKFAQNQDMIDADVITSCIDTCEICRSKRKTYEYFSNLIQTPQIYNSLDEMSFPIFLKPDQGQGSKGTYIASTKDEANFYLQKDSSLLALEYLPGNEYTIDCFTDRNRNLLFAEGRERGRITNGISVNSKPVLDKRFQKLAEIINKELEFQGVWFFQLKERENGELVLLEIAPRIAGTMGLFRARGVNFIQLSLFDKMGKDIGVINNELDLEIDRALMSRYAINYQYGVIYVDFDDTIVVNGKVNTDIIKLLYQAKNNGKNIILISKHKDNIADTLKTYAISEILFDEIILLNENEEKIDSITHMNAVFIDDSFAERKKVWEKFQIPVFSLDAVESLLSSDI